MHVDAVFFHAVPDGDPADAQEGRGLGLVAAGLPQGVDQGGFFIGIRDGPGLWRRSRGETPGAQLGGQVLRRDEAACGHHKGVFQRAVEFPDIAGPGMVQENLHGFPGEAGYRLAAAPAEAAEEMLHQQGEVFQTFPERRQVDGNDIDAEKQVFPKSALLRPGLPGRGGWP